MTPPPAPPSDTVDLPHNTVLTLPNITRYTVTRPNLCSVHHLMSVVFRSRRVARLGETHHSCCHPERETTLALGRMLPSNQVTLYPNGG